jgi:hypothetical protein
VLTDRGRPTVRPANQRYPPPHFVFPLTPPGTAGLDTILAEKSRGERQQHREDQSFTPSQEPSTPVLHRKPSIQETSGLASGPRHRRAVSDSTIQEARETEPGVFKIVITQPATEAQKAKTLEDLAPGQGLLLEISIPSWKIGTPRFSVRGTPFIRGSSYAPTEEFRSSVSFLNRSPGDSTPRLGSVLSPQPSQLHLAPSQSPFLHPHSPVAITPRFPPPLRATYLSSQMAIEPAMFDGLTFRPTSDDRAIVRYCSKTGAVTAATPPRLVAEITSPTFLDYELISDFFLTYRAFLEQSGLLRMLVARLRWAMARDDEVGMVVRVRTFVALRHWILNYFVDDFVVDYNLRVTFAELINDFCNELSNDGRGRKVQLKILAELKKCWRRVCAQYWDGPEFDPSLGADDPLAPGGIAGHRDASLDPSFWEDVETGPPHIGSILRLRDAREERSMYADISKAGYIDSVVINDRPATPEGRSTTEFARRHAASPTSIASVDVLSCSFPSKTQRLVQQQQRQVTPLPPAAHPVDTLSTYGNHDPVATTPKALTGKRVRPNQQGHRRNGSLTDSLREHQSATERVLFRNAELLLTLPYAGSLVRGNLFPPGQAFVEMMPSSAARGPSRQTTLFREQEPPKEKPQASAMSGQGMKKLLGSVRRALSTKGQDVSPTQGNFINISPLGPRGATTNRLPGTAIVPQAQSARPNGIRPPVRIDLLGAGVAEDFKKAVREDAAAEAAKQGFEAPLEGSKVPGHMLDYSVANMEEEESLLLPDGRDIRATTATGLTTGSQSIVIVDDTMAMDLPVMTGALPAANSSVEAFGEALLTQDGNLTPPTTPPGQGLGSPRRSSYILGQHVIRLSQSHDPLPSIVADSASDLGDRVVRVVASEDVVRPSVDSERRIPNRPPLSSMNSRGHLRHRSSRSNRSNASFGHRRYASSFQSGIVPQPTIRSFDATTYSGGSVDGASTAEAAAPPPLRILRRRPGGDLKAVTNVGDLDYHPLRRSHSLGSLTTYSESLRSSVLRSPGGLDSSGFVDVMTSDYSRERAEAFSLGIIAERKSKRPVSLFSTHSSKPVMRPSFEAEAKKLAQIPDDMDDDGGVESALLKLEGKYEKRPPRLSMDARDSRPASPPDDPEQPPAMSEPAGRPSKEEKREHRLAHVGDGPPLPISHLLPDTRANPAGKEPTPSKGSEDVLSFLSEATHDSYTSTPLLERNAEDDSVTRDWNHQSILQGPDEEQQSPDADSQHPSYEFVRKTASLEKIKQAAAAAAAEAEADATRPSTEQSFLDDDSDDDGDSDLSSEMSAELVDAVGPSAETFPPMRPGVVVTRIDTKMLDKPLPAQPRTIGQPPSSPPMDGPAGALQSTADRNSVEVPILHEHQLFDSQKVMPPTPQATPILAQNHGRSFESERDPTGTKEALRNAPQVETDSPMRKFNVHLPFILAFDSEMLAQQFTLIEKDALNEIDWKELIDMRWKVACQTPTTARGNSNGNGIAPSEAENNIDSGIYNNNPRSWVSFLRDTDARGVEVVIARFNIMVKWAASEVVLTQDLEERARCIIKYIHVAAHCRRFRNFATMAQIAMALTSQAVARLTKTWALVPVSDVRTLRDLEALVSPTRNFYNLRAEMEGGGSNLNSLAAGQRGCIPFVGIYTHDLLFNAQRPSEIASSPTTAPLVNFERCRIAASVVKTLLRLIEASGRYTFQPVEGIIERCLWMGALPDEEIRRHSEMLQ